MTAGSAADPRNEASSACRWTRNTAHNRQTGHTVTSTSDGWSRRNAPVLECRRSLFEQRDQRAAIDGGASPSCVTIYRLRLTQRHRWLP
jgi:hypothetical protein